MVRTLRFLAGLTAALCIVSAAAHTEDSLAIHSFGVTATIAPIADFTAEAYQVGSNIPAPEGLTFGNLAAGTTAWQMSPQCLKLSVHDNALAWRVRIYSDNFDAPPSSAAWNYNFGGLVSTSTVGARMPMGWRCTASPGVIEAGDPSQSVTSGWVYLKDKYDYDRPDSPFNDESFATADTTGYCTVAWGTAFGTTISVPNSPQQSAQLPTRESPFYCYLDVNCADAPATSYSAMIKVELLHQ